MKAVAIVLASGSGERFDAKNTPKHLTPILGVPIMIWTLKTIIKSNIFSSIIVVTRDQDLLNTKKAIRKYLAKSPSYIKLTSGSNERMKSFFLGLEYLNNLNLLNQKTIIGLFDANRPFSPKAQLDELYALAQEFGSSCPVRAAVNGVAEIKLKRIVSVPEKSNYVEFVTPEFIKFEILETYFKDKKNTINSLVEYALDSKLNPATCKASLLNSKLTFPEDKVFLEGLAKDMNLNKD